MLSEYLLTFQNTHYAVKSEKLLKQNQLSVGVMALPESLGDFCGICLRLEPEDITLGMELLAKEGIPVEGVFVMEQTSEGRRYLPWQT